MSKPTTDFFNEEMAQRYDERNSKLSAISNCLHFLTTLSLKEAPSEARVLCVGVGTGAEILTLAQAFPTWTFVALDPSLNMLNVCKARMKQAGLDSRCEFVHGFIQDLPLSQPFDVAVSILVAHFVKRDERLDFFQNITKHLKSGGHLVNAEISFDLDSEEFPHMLKGWEQVQTLMGATAESLATLPMQLREVLSIIPGSETERILKESGITTPLKFFQAMMISAWSGKKI